MISPKDIAGAVTAALVLGWGVYVEIRMQNMKRADEQLKRDLNDTKIVDAVKSESSADLLNELSKEFSGHPAKPKT